MIIPLTVQLKLQLQQADHQFNQDQDQDHHIISLDLLNQNENEKSMSSKHVTIPKLQSDSSKLKLIFLQTISFTFILIILLDCLSSFNLIPFTLTIPSLKNPFNLEKFDWNFLDNLLNAEVFDKQFDMIFTTTTIPTRSHTRNWLLESFQVTSNSNSNSNLNSNPNENFNFDSNPNHDFNLNPDNNNELNSNQFTSISEDSFILNNKLNDELTNLDENFNFLKSNSNSKSSKTSNQISNFNLFNDLEDPLPSTKSDSTHEFDFLL